MQLRPENAVAATISDPRLGAAEEEKSLLARAPACGEEVLESATVTLLGREVWIRTHEALGVAGRPWPAQEVAARAVCSRLAEAPSCQMLVELGAGCGALAMALALELEEVREVARHNGCAKTADSRPAGPPAPVVVTSDLAEVLWLLEENCQSLSRSHPRPGELRLESCALSWGDEQVTRSLAARANRDGGSCCVVACECAYWGGWDLFEDDTREPLAATLDQLIVGDEGLGLLVHEVRDAGREAGLYDFIRARGLEVKREEPSGSREVIEGSGEVEIWSVRRKKS